MGLFCKCNADHAAVQQRLEDVSKTVDKLKRERSDLLQEFEVLLDKVNRWMQRTNKRVRDEAASAARPADEPDEPAPALDRWANHPTVRRVMARRGQLANGGE